MIEYVFFFPALCGGVLEQGEGTLQSPNYPDEYRANKECTWKITVDPASQVALLFQAFEVTHLHAQFTSSPLEIFYIYKMTFYTIFEKQKMTECNRIRHKMMQYLSDDVTLLDKNVSFLCYVEECP